MTSQYNVERLNHYLAPCKLNRCKYDLLIYGRIRKSIVTKIINREAVLVQLIARAFEISEQFGIVENMDYRIMLTEDKVRSVLLDSNIDKSFIKFLYEPIRETQEILHNDLDI
jgi:hypothetical protein